MNVTMRSRRMLYPLLLAGLLLACGGSREYPVAREIVDGVEHITCPGYSRDGAVEYEMVEDLSIGDDSDDHYIFNQPNHLGVDSRGNIYVIDWGDNRLLVYDSTGAWIRTIGREGQGPGEFSMPTYLAVSAADSIYLNDSRNRRINVYDDSGCFIRSFRYAPYRSEIRVDGSSRVFLEEPGRIEQEKLTDMMQAMRQTFSIQRLKTAGSPAYTYGPYEGSTKMIQRMDNGGTLTLGSQHWPNTLWTVNSAGRVIEGYNADYRLNVINDAGKVLFNFGRSYDPVPNPLAGRSGNPEHNPAFGPRILLDEKGNIWLKLYTKDSKNEDETVPVIYDVWSPDGIFMRQVEVPYTIHMFYGGKAYCIRRTDEEVTVKRFVLREK